MKGILVGICFTVITTSTFAASLKFDCAALDDAKNNGFEDLSLSLSNDQIVYSANQATGAAKRDPAFDRKYPTNAQVMFSENSKTSPFVSDTGTNIFVDKKMLSGKNGTIAVSTGQPNDGESGPVILWDTIHFNCSAN